MERLGVDDRVSPGRLCVGLEGGRGQPGSQESQANYSVHGSRIARFAAQVEPGMRMTEPPS